MGTPSHDPHRSGVAEDALLEAAPPFFDRRSLMVGGGLGVTSLVLPSAMSAASVPTVEPTGGAFAYPVNADVLLSWTAFDSTSTPTAVAGTPGGASVSGTHGRGGAGGGAGDDPRVAAFAPTLVYTQASGRLESPNTFAAVDVTADFGGSFKGSAGNLTFAMSDSGSGGLTASVSGSTLTVDLGGTSPTATNVATAIGGISGLSATQFRIGSFTSDDVGLSVGAMTGGADVPDATRWDVLSTTNQLTLSGGSASPYLEWTLTNGTGADATISTLVLYRFRSEGALKLAFYVSTGADFASPVLRRTVSFSEDLTRHLVIPLSSGAGVVLADGASVTVRAFPYSTPTARTVRLVRYSSTDGGALQGLLGVDAIQTDVVGTTGETGTLASAFIGVATAT